MRVSDKRERIHILISSMRIALLAHGSRGDIQPILALGDTLRSRGHSVVLTVNSNLVAWAKRSGLDVVETELDMEALLKSADGRRVLANGKITDFFNSLAAAEDDVRDDMLRATIEATDGADIVLSTVLTMMRGGLLAQHRQVPFGLVATMPVQATTSWASMFSPWPHLGAPALNWLSHGVLQELYWHKAQKPRLEACELLGLDPRNVRVRLEDIPSVHIYSDWLAPRPSDWSAIHRTAGFCPLSPELRERLGEGVPSELDAWLKAGPAPVFFGLGSMPVLDPKSWLEFIAETTKRRGIRALVGAGWSDLDRAHLPEHVFVAGAFDHDAVLPRCRAAMHHGGAGTTHAALRAGLPSYVLSVFADQPFWGWRTTALEVGGTMPFASVNLELLDAAIDSVLDPAKQARAQRLGAALRAEQGALRAASVIEQWAAVASSVRVAA